MKKLLVVAAMIGTLSTPAAAGHSSPNHLAAHNGRTVVHSRVLTPLRWRRDQAHRQIQTVPKLPEAAALGTMKCFVTTDS